MTGQLDIFRDGNLGIISLNRPEAINALSLEMVEGIIRTLEQWRDDAAIRAVLFTGQGPRGFCAGGDVRALRQFVLEGRPEAADSYLAAEYNMNALIATYPKPTVAVSHGVVMGGGIGIAGHCRYRFTTPDARFAMPESAIGFVVDVGVNHILAKAPLHRALPFLMSGTTVGVADALELGLADCVYDAARREVIQQAAVAAASVPDIEAALVLLAQAEMQPVGDAGFVTICDRQPDLDWTDPAAIVSGITDPALAATLRSRSPTSLVAIHAAQLAARRVPGIRDVLDIELAVASVLCRRPDFAEGVRAVLVDKDQRPTWQPAELVQVSRSEIDDAITTVMSR